MTHTTLTPSPATSTAPAGPAVRSRTASIALWVLQVLLAAAFVMAAVTKFTRYPEAVATFDRIGFGHWFMYLVAALELAGAVGLLIRNLSGPAALALTGILTGAILTQLLLFAPATAITPAAYLVPIAIIAWGRRHHTIQLLRQASRRTTR
jgi:putative oxidoreductase